MNINSNYFANPFIKKDFISKELLKGIMKNLEINAQSLNINKTLKVQN